jgi:SAM-dependent methyltransferase
MRIEEAEWIGRRLERLNVGTVLELGSSTEAFRKSRGIDRLIHAPLKARGVQIVCTDMKPGADIVGDIYEEGVQERLRAVNAKAVLCCNIFEHVPDRKRLAQVCDRVLAPGGYLVVSVPFSYPHHNDPIDTYYRPSPEDIAALFSGYTLIDAEIVKSKSFGQELLADPVFLMKAIPLRTLWLFKLWLPKDQYANLNHRLLWLFRPYRISCAILRKPTRH